MEDRTKVNKKYKGNRKRKRTEDERGKRRRTKVDDERDGGEYGGK
jgi:hypothetical protein